MGTRGLLYITNPTNAAGISNAVKIASGLLIGMAVADVHKYMREHGMGQTLTGGAPLSATLDRMRTNLYG